MTHTLTPLAVHPQPVLHHDFSLSSTTELTSQQLKEFDGSNPSKAIYVSIKSTIYDVSAAGNFYGPGGPYALFAGREASRALAKMSKNEEDVNGEIADLSEKEIGVLEDWEKKFQAKYPVVGRLVS